MPVTYRMDEGLGVFVLTLRGRLTDVELVETAERLLHDPAKPPGVDALVDTREVDLRDASSGAIRSVAQIFQQGPGPDPGIRVAFVAPHDDAYGLARMYEAYRQQSTREFQVFREMDEALAWLGAPRG